MKDTCFTENFSDSVASLTEKQLIGRFCKNLSPFIPQSPLGSGDDCAVIDTKFFRGKILSTSDAVILGRHFLPETPANLAGKKLLNRNISDIASMGGIPKFAMSSTIISPKISLKWLDLFCEGLKEAASEYNIQFIGGDVARGEDDFFSMHITLLGDCIKPMLRIGAKIGDKIFVTGALGASFESGKHLNFRPRVKEGIFLSKTNLVSSCTDISDGIASDLSDILNPKISALLYEKDIPVFNFNSNNLQKALCDGEDYELLFTLNSNACEADFIKNYELELGCKPIKIGEIVSRKDFEILIDFDGVQKPISAKGFSHFA